MGSIALGSTDRLRPAQSPDDTADWSVAVGERFVAAVAALDYKAIFGALTSDVRFRYLIPPGPGETVGAAEVAAKYFDWFGDADVLDVESVVVRPIDDRLSVRYRFVLRKGERWEVVEQQTFMDLDERGRIAASSPFSTTEFNECNMVEFLWNHCRNTPSPGISLTFSGSWTPKTPVRVD